MMLESSFAIVKKFNTGHRAPTSHFTIVNDDSSVINMWHLSLTDYARVVIYDCNMFII